MDKLRLFDEQLARKPNLYPWTKEFIDRLWAGFWTPNEFDFRADAAQFYTELNDQERLVFIRTLSAIAQIEVAVKKFWGRLGDTLPHPSINDLGDVMAHTEVIHNLAYEKLLDVLKLTDVFIDNLNEPVIRNRVEYLRKYNKKMYEDDKKQFIYAIILFTLFVENVSLFSQFYIVLWFNRYRNIFKDTAQQVNYTKNEETLHAQIGIKLINTLREEYPEYFDDDLKNRIIEECRVAYKAESDIIAWILGDFKDENISVDILQGYIANRFNQSLNAIGYPNIFEQKYLDETLWMQEETFGSFMTDFFHGKPIAYGKNNKTYNEDDLF